MTPIPTVSQELSDQVWSIVLRAAERDPRIKALLFAQPDGGELRNPGSTEGDLLSAATVQAPSPGVLAGAGAQGGRG